MVAIALPTTSTTTAPGRSRRHPLPSGGSGRGHRPALTLVPAPGRAPLAGRRAASLAGAALLALAVLVAGAYLVRTPAPAPGAAPVTTTYVAAEGDTLWSIAVAHAPAGEAATYVEELVAANGSAAVAPGQAVALPRP